MGISSLIPFASTIRLPSWSPPSTILFCPLHRNSISNQRFHFRHFSGLSRGCMLPEKPAEYIMVVDDDRPLAYFPPDIWGDRFDNFTLEDNLRMERYAMEVEPLKEEVRVMLLDNSMDLEKKMNLIDVVERLGFPYYYEDEIEQQLDQIFKQLSEDNFDMDYNLRDTATQFRIFRQHGYNMPCDVFNKFTDDEGKFKETLRSDGREMLSLYEAAHLRVQGEDILEEALVFTTQFLNSVGSHPEQARRPLILPLHRGNQRVHAQHFISFYEEDESHNEKLLQLAKIEFNKLQLLHCQELSQIQKWWKKHDFTNKPPCTRSRSVESHVFSIGVFYEPRFSSARILFTKLVLVTTVLDDTFDSYGTFEELQHLADALERWDLRLKDQLPAEYLKNVYEFVISTFDEFSEELSKIGRSFAVDYLKEQLQILIKNYIVEANWLATRYCPTFEEYMENRRATIGIRISVLAALMGMEDVKDVASFEQPMESDYNAMIACEDSIGLLDDRVTGEAEIARGSRLVTSLECYMKDYNISREEAQQIMKKMIDDGWKVMVKERLLINEHDISSKRNFELTLNVGRGSTHFFAVGDAFTLLKFSNVKDEIMALYAMPFSI